MIIFGTQGRDEARGLVADMCPQCQEVRAFAVIDQYEVPHVYWVNMGKGTLRGTAMRCVHCRTLCTFDQHKYREVMSCAEAEHADLETLVSRTHPRLLGALPVQAGSQCHACGFQRERPFRFCPQCGLHSGAR